MKKLLLLSFLLTHAAYLPAMTTQIKKELKATRKKATQGQTRQLKELGDIKKTLHQTNCQLTQLTSLIQDQQQEIRNLKKDLEQYKNIQQPAPTIVAQQKSEPTSYHNELDELLGSDEQ